MPIFEYRCSACGHQFEDLRPQSEADEIRACPKCGKPQTQRVMSPFACGCGGLAPSESSGSSGRRRGG